MFHALHNATAGGLVLAEIGQGPLPGRFVALAGPGQVWLQSMPLPILAHALEPYLGRPPGPQTAEAGAMRGIIGSILRGQ
jgi:hypothetical protein